MEIAQKVKSWKRAFGLLVARGKGVCLAVLFFAIAAAPLEASDYTTGAVGWLERPHLTGDRTRPRERLKGAGFTVRSRLSQFIQGIVSGDGEDKFESGGKIDLQLITDLAKFGLWDGLSFTVKAEHNFGDSLNGFGGTLVPVNTALAFPGIVGEDAIDITNFYFTQRFGDTGVLLFGKINMFDVASSKRFAGGAGIDSFWNTTFVAPPSGLVPPYLFGAVVSYKTPSVNYGLWIYDPLDCVNRMCLEAPFSEGVTIRGSIEFPVMIAGLQGHQGFVALYSTYDGTDLTSLDKITTPPFDPALLDTKSARYYFAYTFDQYLYRSPTNPDEGVGLFGQFGISDGNPTRLHWSAHIGLGGTGLIPGRSRDKWGIGYYYSTLSDPLKDAVAPLTTLRDEQGVEAFYEFAVAPWFSVGTDLQVIRPGAGDTTAVFVGFRSVLEF